MNDITERKRIEDALRAKTAELDQFFNLALDLLCIADAEGYFRHLNPMWEQVLGYQLSELEGQPLLSFVHPDDSQSTIEAISKLSAKHPVLNFVNRCRCRDGSYRHIEWRAFPAEGLIYAAARDITERVQAEEKLRYAGTHDSLTVLYNRTYFEEEVRRLERGRTYPVSVALVDVDGLKEVNDALGHAAGDDLLRRVGQVLLTAFRTEDVVARIGGDEFAVLLPGVDEAMAEDAIQRVRIVLTAHNRSADGSALSLSFGVATGKKGCRLDSLLKQADDRMYADKLSKSIKGSNDTTRKKATEVTPQRKLRLARMGTNIQMKDVDSNA